MPRYTANFVHTSLSSRRWSRSLCPFCSSALSWSSVSCASWMVHGRRWRASLTGSRKMLLRRTRTVRQRLSCKTKAVHLSLEIQCMRHITVCIYITVYTWGLRDVENLRSWLSPWCDHAKCRIAQTVQNYRGAQQKQTKTLDCQTLRSNRGLIKLNCRWLLLQTTNFDDTSYVNSIS